jgi:NADH-quinone oxidoreductase subunit C
MTSEESKAQPQETPEAAPPAIGPVANLFKTALPDVNFDFAQGALDELLTVDRKDVHRVLERAKRDEALAFDFLRDLSGVDYQADGIEVVYHLYSYKHRHNVTVKARVTTDSPTLPTATDLWRAADWHEREARDMFGVVFEGHPNLVPILLPEDMLDHFPLRKDNPLAPLEEWQGEMLGPNMASAGHIPPGSGFDVEPSKEGE